MELPAFCLLPSDLLDTNLNWLSKLLKHKSYKSEFQKQRPVQAYWQFLPLWSYWRPESRWGSSWWGPAGCSSSRCTCGCRPRWKAWPRGGCSVPARPCSSAGPPCSVACCGSLAWGNSRRSPTPSSSPDGSRPPPPPPPGRHWIGTVRRRLKITQTSSYKAARLLRVEV